MKLILLSILLISLVPTVEAKDKPLPEDCQVALGENNSESIITHCASVPDTVSAETAYRIGAAYELSPDLENPGAAALKWYLQAAEAGHPLAQRNLAALYDGGIGINRDPFKAFYWYQLAAQQGQPHSQLMTGMFYLYGTGTVQDPEQAKQWFKAAAHSGEPNGQYMYGKIVYDTNAKEAVDWYQKAAAQGNRYALYQLGLMHYRGEHLLESDKQALEYAERAIIAGHQKAQVLREKLQERQVSTGKAPTPSVALVAKQQPTKTAVASKSVETPAQSISASKPQPGTAGSVKSDDSQWMLAQPANHFTIQLALMGQYASIQRFAKFYPSVTETRYYHSRFTKGDMFMLIKGSYATQAEAKAALESLPEKVKKSKPWIRQFNRLQEQYVPPIEVQP